MGGLDGGGWVMFGTNEEEEQLVLALGFMHEDGVGSRKNSTVKNSLSQRCVG